MTHSPDVRGQAILSAIISEHLLTGEPVGSKVLAEKFSHIAGMSSATIRNVMSDLEDAGMCRTAAYFRRTNSDR